MYPSPRAPPPPTQMKHLAGSLPVTRQTQIAEDLSFHMVGASYSLRCIQKPFQVTQSFTNSCVSYKILDPDPL